MCFWIIRGLTCKSHPHLRRRVTEAQHLRSGAIQVICLRGPIQLCNRKEVDIDTRRSLAREVVESAH